MSWTNYDGLLVRFDNELGAVAEGGEVMVHGAASWGKFKLEDATALPLVGGVTAPVADAPYIPAGAHILRAYMVATEGFTTGTSATLDVGFLNAAGGVVDIDGIDEDIAASALAEGDTVACDGDMVAGNYVGAANVYPVFTRVTGTFTAGAGYLLIEYI